MGSLAQIRVVNRWKGVGKETPNGSDLSSHSHLCKLQRVQESCGSCRKQVLKAVAETRSAVQRSEHRLSKGSSFSKPEKDTMQTRESRSRMLATKRTNAAPSGNAEAYNRAKSLLTSLSQTMEDLEYKMSVQQQELIDTSTKMDNIINTPFDGSSGGISYSQSAPRQDGEVSSLRQELELEREAVAQQESEMQDLRARLQQAVKLSGQAAELQKAVEERDLRLSALAKELTDQDISSEEGKAEKQEALRAAEVRVEQLTAETQRLQEEIQMRDGIMAQMQKEAAMSTKTLQTAAKAIANVREHNSLLESELEQQRQLLTQSREELNKMQSAIAEKEQALKAADHRMGRLEQAVHEMDSNLEQENLDKQNAQKAAAQSKEDLLQARMRIKELAEKINSMEKATNLKSTALTQLKNQQAKTALALEQANQSLHVAQSQIQTLEQQVENAQDALREEVEASTSALKDAASREQALRMAEGRVRELSAETVGLRAQVESKDKTMAAVREETLKNADMLMTAQKTRKSLLEAEGKLGHLTQQVAALEEEIQSRDSLLADIKAETFRSAETLKMAAKVNQLLNETREREAQLQETLEEKEDVISELRRELHDNARAARAELALRGAEQRRLELEEENQALRMGVNARDQVLRAMEDEVERSAEVLDSGQKTRENLRQMQRRTADLEAQLQNREAKLAALQSELTAMKMSSLRSEQQQHQFPSANSRPLGGPVPAKITRNPLPPGPK